MQDEHFDYIIVGGGSAGCVLANRLSAEGNNKVCLLEAGPEDKTLFITIPGAFAYFMFTKKYNWSFDSEPVGDIRKGEPVFCPQGKGLGGGSAINAMIYIRGHRVDYDHWASLGNEGWGWEDLLPYFKKNECNERGGDELHGDSGPLYVSNCRNYYPINERFLQAASESGFPLNNDFNGPEQEGAGLYQFTIRDGKRCSASHAYLRPVRTRTNLSVECHALASRILLEGNKATGVEYRQKGEIRRIYADKEVIVSAGAYNSPKLLMLSGIGGEDALTSAGITPFHVLPGVGENLQEHVDSCVLQESRKSDGFRTSLGGLLKMWREPFRYLFGRKGKLESSITQAGAFLKTAPDLPAPDIQLHFLPLLYDDSGRNLKLMAQSGYSCHVCVLRPKSRGRMTLRSADPAEPPRIELNFFDHPDDRKTMANGIRVARKILSASSFDDYRGAEMNPGPDAQSDDEILARCKEKLGLVYHPVGTCKMGNDEMAVVDSSLRVHGLDALRVVDASIMPTLIGGNTNAPTMVIAEKAADLILKGK
ncbi:MAG: choline dehydrogenase [Xanthomonadales bacterium]|nr:choline dehydrogenase [Gammaproteobacteria bacterium]NND57679.1 choline dehydrogenase [Xanthomonadales bacterium]